MSVLLFFSFLAGFVTILAPCIWPLLPIVLSASAGAGKRRPLGLTLGIMTSFTVFTLSISYLEKILHLDANVFRLVAVILIAALGLMMMIPPLATAFENFINRILQPFHRAAPQQATGFAGGYAAGCSIGLLWAPCAGPILATIATLAATQAVDRRGIFVTLAYVFGLGIPLFILCLGGSKYFARLRQVNRYTGKVQQLFGLIMIVAAVLIYTNYDKTIQVKILNAFPWYGHLFERVESNEAVSKELRRLRGDKEAASLSGPQGQTLPDLGPAAELTGISQWLNGGALTLAQLRGRVVLVDFWTYSCINCVRTLPHVTGWYEKYKENGFVVIGVHTPEFAFEKKNENVQAALRQFKIHYPVALDNDYQTWRAFENHYWPAEYLIDAQGRIRRTHFGEGKYDEMEQAIRHLLQEAGHPVASDTSSMADTTPRIRRTPETYLGRRRAERFASAQAMTAGGQVFSAPVGVPQDHFAYEGYWSVSPEAGVGKAKSALVLQFQGDKVFLVAGSANPQSRIKVFLDGQPLAQAIAGADVDDAQVVINAERLYHLVDLHGRPGAHRLRLECQDDGIAVYAFTFG